MAEQLCVAGGAPVVYNRTRAKAEPLQSKGATIAAHPAEVVQATEVIILMLTDAPAIRAVVLSDAVRPGIVENDGCRWYGGICSSSR